MTFVTMERRVWGIESREWSGGIIGPLFTLYVLPDRQFCRCAIRYLVVPDEHLDADRVSGRETIRVRRAISYSIHPCIAHAVYDAATFHVPARDHALTRHRLAVDEQAAIHIHVNTGRRIAIAYPRRDLDRRDGRRGRLSGRRGARGRWRQRGRASRHRQSACCRRQSARCRRRARRMGGSGHNDQWGGGG